MQRFKTGLKEGPWSPEEDEKLINFIQKHDHGNWQALPKLAGLKRYGNSCKSRWWNHLLPDIKRAKISEEEEQTILNSHSKGRKFSQEKEEETILETLTGNDEIKNFNSGEEKILLSHLPIQGELQGMTSTQSAVVSENLMDFTYEFANGKIFESKKALMKWIRTVGRKNGFAIVIKRSDSGRITFCCERSGQYRNTRENAPNKKGMQLRNIHTKKCGCPFELQYQKDSGDNWKLKIARGVHNHAIRKLVSGRSYLGSLSKTETLLAIEMYERNVCPKDILKELQKRDVNNVSTEKDIYNVVQRDKVKKMAKSSSNTHNSNTFVSCFPVWLQPYINYVKDVVADGHCGFRAIADLMDFGENDWKRVRKDLLYELNSNLENYELLYGSQEIVEELKNALSISKNRPASCDKWMTMPNMGHLIASAYNVVLFFVSLQQSLTFLPLRSPQMLIDSRKHIAIGLVNNNHFVEVFLLPDHPIPPIANKWKEFRHSCAKGWDTVYNLRIQLFQKIMHKDVDTNAVIDIDGDSSSIEILDMIDSMAKLVPNTAPPPAPVPAQFHSFSMNKCQLERDLDKFPEEATGNPSANTLLSVSDHTTPGIVDLSMGSLLSISSVEGIGNDDVVEIKEPYKDQPHFQSFSMMNGCQLERDLDKFPEEATGNPSTNALLSVDSYAEYRAFLKRKLDIACAAVAFKRPNPFLDFRD